MRYSAPVATTVLRPACLALARLVRTPAIECVTRGFLLVSVFLGMEGFLLPDCAQAQTQGERGSVVRTVETMLSGPDWRLGSFAKDEGEQHEVFLQKFDDRDFWIVTVPGKVQKQLGFQGMDLYYQNANTPAYLAPSPSGLRVALPDEHCATLTAENLITGRTLYVVIRDKTKRGVEVPDQVACTASLA